MNKFDYYDINNGPVDNYTIVCNSTATLEITPKTINVTLSDDNVVYCGENITDPSKYVVKYNYVLENGMVLDDKLSLIVNDVNAINVGTYDLIYKDYIISNDIIKFL